LSILLTHLLKCTAHPKKPSLSWPGTIGDQRDRIADLIEDSPSLRDYPAEILERCYPRARRDAARQMLRPCPKAPFPRAAPFGIEEILDPLAAPPSRKLRSRKQMW